VNAGHNPGVLVRGSGGATALLDSGGLPLGLLAGSVYRCENVAVEPGDLLCLYSDGITEASSPADEEFVMRPIRMIFTTTLLTPVVIAAVMAGGALTSPASAEDERLPGGRHIKHYTVKSGDTATGLAVRFHAWTDELIAHNHLGPTAGLTVGERIEIPVVTAAVPHQKSRPTQHRSRGRAATNPPRHRVADPPRQRVRRAIVRVSRRQGVDPQLSLAVSWQEAGWQMHHVSSDGAVGAMQVLPSTTKWMDRVDPLTLRSFSTNGEFQVPFHVTLVSTDWYQAEYWPSPGTQLRENMSKKFTGVICPVMVAPPNEICTLSPKICDTPCCWVSRSTRTAGPAEASVAPMIGSPSVDRPSSVQMLVTLHAFNEKLCCPFGFHMTVPSGTDML